VPNLDELIQAQNGIANIVVINQENPVQEQIGNVPANGPINEPVHDAGIDIPMVLPHIYHNASDEQAIREWATRMHVKLEVLVEAESRNNRIEVSQALAAVFNTSHPNAKSGSLEPNLTVEEEDAPMQDNLELQGVQDRHAINDNEASIVWNAMRNGNISNELKWPW